jgi:hypothetical protein
MAQIIIATDQGDAICTFIVPPEPGWGQYVEDQLATIIEALQDAIDWDAGIRPEHVER